LSRRAAARFEQAQHGREAPAEADVAAHALQQHFDVARAQGDADAEPQAALAVGLDRGLGLKVLLADAAPFDV
jgi:hypothetical protein